MGIGATAQMGPTEYSHFGWTIMMGSDIGPLIPHAGAPNCLLPLILLSSGSKSEFGSSTTLIKGKPVAAALGVIVNPNLNCGDPVPAPLDGVIAATAHFVGMTLGDVIAGFAHMAFDIGLQKVIGALCDKFDGVSQKVYEKFLFGPMCSAFEHIGAGPIASWFLRNDLQEMVAKGLAAKITKVAISDLIGSPIGYSFKINALGLADSHLSDDSDGSAIDNAHQAVQQYFDSPAVETHDVPPTSDASTSSTDAAGDNAVDGGSAPTDDGGAGSNDAATDTDAAPDTANPPVDDDSSSAGGQSISPGSDQNVCSPDDTGSTDADESSEANSSSSSDAASDAATGDGGQR
jgi:hypothetical protein